MAWDGGWPAELGESAASHHEHQSVLERTVSGNVVLVGLGSLKGGSTANELVRPLGLVRALSDLLVGLSLIGIVCPVLLAIEPNWRVVE